MVFLFLYFIFSYEFKIMNSVKVQCRDWGHQIASNRQKSRTLAFISSDEADKPSLFHEVIPGLTGCMLFPLTAQFFVPVLIPRCTEVSLPP